MWVKANASGWRRNTGNQRSLGLINLEEAEVIEGRARQYHADKVTVELNAIGITITWNRQLNLQGDYAVSVYLDEEAIGQLFRWKFGEEVTPAVLKETGLQLGTECIRDAIGGMTLSQLLGLFAAHASNAEPAAS